MSEGKRPGGLTALAVINFVYGGFSVLGIFGLIFLLNAPSILGGLRDKLVEDGAEQAQIEKMDSDIAKMEQSVEDVGGHTGIYIGIGASILFAVILITSGVGYLKQRRGMGRKVGNIYGVLGVIYNLGFALMTTFQFGVLIGLLYPVLTLVLINTTFKDDLVR
ncbi:MAG: hypothetical protein P1V36_15000 [Planctomycetota bacterium]|nr:hypothetical protein [Planctomycetota bacterium]